MPPKFYCMEKIWSLYVTFLDHSKTSFMESTSCPIQIPPRFCMHHLGNMVFACDICSANKKAAFKQEVRYIDMQVWPSRQLLLDT